MQPGKNPHLQYTQSITNCAEHASHYISKLAALCFGTLPSLEPFKKQLSMLLIALLAELSLSIWTKANPLWSDTPRTSPYSEKSSIMSLLLVMLGFMFPTNRRALFRCGSLLEVLLQWLAWYFFFLLLLDFLIFSFNLLPVSVELPLLDVEMPRFRVRKLRKSWLETGIGIEVLLSTFSAPDGGEDSSSFSGGFIFKPFRHA